MSSSHHDDHHSSEQKPVSFTVPLILASVLILIIVLFLSLCDPKSHHEVEAGHGHAAPVEAMHHEATEQEINAPAAEEPTAKKDSVSAETTVPVAEPAHH